MIHTKLLGLTLLYSLNMTFQPIRTQQYLSAPVRSQNTAWNSAVLCAQLPVISQHNLLVLFSQNPSAPAAENSQLPRETDLSPGQPLQPGMSSSGVGVIGRRSIPDLGAIGDNLTGTSASSGHDQLYNLQMIEAAFHKLPQPKDSERAKTYVPVWVFARYWCLLLRFEYIFLISLYAFIFSGILQSPLLVTLKFRHRLYQILPFGKELVATHWLRICCSLHSTINRLVLLVLSNFGVVFLP